MGGDRFDRAAVTLNLSEETRPKALTGRATNVCFCKQEAERVLQEVRIQLPQLAKPQCGNLGSGVAGGQYRASPRVAFQWSRRYGHSHWHGGRGSADLADPRPHHSEFTRNWLVRKNPGRLPVPFGRFDMFVVGLGALALVG
jgi:uncharacterized protein YlaN (UPF0358 family)